jgi:thioredoxin-dependent peroxiredoxin
MGPFFFMKALVHGCTWTSNDKLSGLSLAQSLTFFGGFFSRTNVSPMAKGLQVGDRAPDFTLRASTGKSVRLSSLKGKRVVLYFYPRDDTPGCTIEACSFRDNMPKFDGLDAVVLGVSKDSLDSHAKFINKYSLNFTLLSDEDGVAHRLYDTWKQKVLYGKKYMGTERSTFVIGADGKIKKIFRKVNPQGHEAEVLAALNA